MTLACAVAPSVLGTTPAAAARGGESGAVDQVEATRLAAVINDSLSRLPGGASAMDAEGAINAALNTSGANIETKMAALGQVNASSPAIAQALQRARTALRREQDGKGYASRGNGNQGFVSSFSSPVVSVGGGSSNYR